MANYYYLAESLAVGDLIYTWNFHWPNIFAYRTDLVGDLEPFPTGGMIYLFDAEHNMYKK